MNTDTPAREPLFNAPILVVGMSLLLVGLHAATYLLEDREFIRLQYDFALVPRRFWAEGGSQDSYPDMLSGLVTLLTTGFLHTDWMHVIVNSLMLLAFGTPVFRALKQNSGAGAAWLKWAAVYFGSVVGGSIAYLAIADVTSPAAVGASGGTSGLIAAAFLLDPWGRLQSPLSRSFLTMTAAFVIANALLTVAGPYLIGMGIAWEAHAGGYIAGAALMVLLGRQKKVQGEAAA